MPSLLEKLGHQDSAAADVDAIPPVVDIVITCPVCRSTKLWFDRYGGGPHCFACRPPPTKSLVARVCDVAAAENGLEPPKNAQGPLTGYTTLSPGIHASSGPVVSLDDEFDRQYRCYVSRTGKWFVMERRNWNSLHSVIIDMGPRDHVDDRSDEHDEHDARDDLPELETLQ